MYAATKKCPYCAEEILAEAIKCKHCGETVDDKARKKAEAAAAKKKTSPVAGGCLIILLLFTGWCVYLVNTTPSPPPSPSRSVTTPAPVPKPTGPVLELVDWNWGVSSSDSFVEGQGQVKNISDRSLENVMVIVTFLTDDGGCVDRLQPDTAWPNEPVVRHHDPEPSHEPGARRVQGPARSETFPPRQERVAAFP